MKMAHDRSSRYIVAVREYMKSVGHATNSELIEALRLRYPGVSATTVHRVTARMVERDELCYAPGGKDNAMRFDGNLTPHDHFLCEQCGMIKDAELSVAVRPLIERAIGDGCSISGRLTVFGRCKQCSGG